LATWQCAVGEPYLDGCKRRELGATKDGETMSSRYGGVVLVFGALFMATIAILTGCTSVKVAYPVRTTRPPSAQPTATTSPSAVPSSSASSTGASGQAPCVASSLFGAVEPVVGGGGAGNIQLTLSMTNTGGKACTVAANAKVTLNAGGTQVGAAARQSARATAPVLTIEPGKSVIASMTESRAENYAGCVVTPVDGAKVSLAGGSDGLRIAYETSACDNPKIALLTIGAFELG